MAGHLRLAQGSDERNASRFGVGMKRHSPAERALHRHNGARWWKLVGAGKYAKYARILLQASIATSKTWNEKTNMLKATRSSPES